MLDTARGVWRDVAPALAQRYRVHLIDLPRHGGSRPWTGRLDDAIYRRFLPERASALVAVGVEEARAKHAHGEGALDDWQIDAYGPFPMRVDHLPDLSRMQVPTLWVRGDRDRLVGHAEMAAAEAATPGSRLVTMRDAGHVVTDDRPEALTVLVQEFLVETLDGDRPR